LPQAKAPLFRVYSGEIHGHAIVRTSESRHHLQLIGASVWAQQEVSAQDIVTHRAIGFGTYIGKNLPLLTIVVQENLKKAHLHVMHVTKHLIFLARPCNRHTSSSPKPTGELS
jgi:hypothetical protein